MTTSADQETSDNGTRGAGMNGDDMGSGLAGLLISNLYLAAGFIAVLVLGAVAYWFGAWTIVGASPSFEDTLGRVLVSTSDGLFIGAGLLGAVGALRLVRGIERRIAASYSRG